jgi:hypothetical protein
LDVPHHEEDDQMEHWQYRHFLSQAREGADAVVIPAEGRDHIGCFANQVNLTRALVRDLDEVMKEIQQLGNHGEEASEDHRARGFVQAKGRCHQEAVGGEV